MCVTRGLARGTGHVVVVVGGGGGVERAQRYRQKPYEIIAMETVPGPPMEISI